MTEEELDFRINLAIAKGRNIVYYKEHDPRERAQYIHIIRDYRKLLVSLVSEIPDALKYQVVKSCFNNLINVIDPKIKSEETTGAIINIKNILCPLLQAE